MVIPARLNMLVGQLPHCGYQREMAMPATEPATTPPTNGNASASVPATSPR
jgi:hypothetical protein